MSTTARLEFEHEDFGGERRQRWSGYSRQMRRFTAEKRKLEAETFVVAPSSADGGDEQGKQTGPRRGSSWPWTMEQDSAERVKLEAIKCSKL
ncbi:hypothetical protein Bca4012_002649 [Brassica carinata]|uniref:Uncharacterized protein n=1 Tax=Brassica carinata TaxID=52824 RepID=A0A8X7RXJ3_BRACI|nr:hypothetical protein Bca52824_042587 [Brassica carinata]